MSYKYHGDGAQRWLCRAHEGRLDQATDFFRFFIEPGMGLCGGGPGPNTFDARGGLDRWVEQGTTPDKVFASDTLRME